MQSLTSLASSIRVISDFSLLLFKKVFSVLRSFIDFVIWFSRTQTFQTFQCRRLILRKKTDMGQMEENLWKRDFFVVELYLLDFLLECFKNLITFQ